MGGHNSKRKLFYNAKTSAYYFYVKTIISVDFQICISVPLIFSVAFGIYFENDVLYNCNQFLHESHLNFDKLLTHKLLSFMKKFSNLSPHLEFFRIDKRGLNASEGD